MYTIKNTERNNEKASDYETFSMLYLLGICSDRDQIDLVLIDCFNDVTGADELVNRLWDVQSKGHKNNTPLQIGEHLFTLYDNFLSDFPFKNLILFLENVSDIHVHNLNSQVFKFSNFTSPSKDKIREGLTRKYARSASIAISQVPTISIQTFLNKVDFVICTKNKSENVKNLIEFKNKNVRDDDFFIEIFNEILGMQSKLKNINVENLVLLEPKEILSYEKVITRNQIVTLLVNRLVGVELFSNHGIPIEFVPYIEAMELEDRKDLLQSCVSSICRTFFDKNNKVNVWRLLESVIRSVMKDRTAGIEQIAMIISNDIMNKIPTLDDVSMRFLIARIKGWYRMILLKAALGNMDEAFVECRFTNGLNIIYSNDNNKGKTILIQGIMYSIGNSPIFPTGLDVSRYYFYSQFDHNNRIFEFMR